MEDWGAVRVRLEELIAGVPPEWLSRNGADIRAALERIKELEKELAEARRNG